MAILKPGQLASGSYTISGSFSGSFQGSGAGLNNIPSSAIVGLSSTQIASGAVSASVSTGTGSFTVTSGSSTFMFVSSSGNVGLGTTTPSRLLHVSEGGTRLYQTFNPGVPTLYVYHGRTEHDSTVRFENASGDQLYFGGNGLFVTGNTTIGNGSTTLSARLGIKGSGTTSATTALLVQNSNSETTIIAKNDRTIGLGRNAFNGEGYGGIAIGYPDLGNLQYSSYDAHTFNVYTNIGYQTALLIKGNGASSRVLIGPSSDTTYKFQVSGSNASGSVNLDNTLYVSGSRVGIGTSSPTFRLEVQGGDVRFANGLTIGTAGSVGWQFSSNTVTLIQNGFIGVDVASGREFSFTNTSFSTTYLKLASVTGNVLINTTTDSGAKMTLRGSGATSATTALRVENSNASASLAVLDNGYVGIGTSSPSNSLTIKTGVNDDGILLESSTGNPLFLVRKDGTSNNTAELFQYANGAIRLAIRSTSNFSYFNGGNFGFGTTTDAGYRLTISGSSTSGSLNADNTLYVSGSNVGIGTSTPAQTFQVYRNTSAGYLASFNSGATLNTNASLTVRIENANLPSLQGLNPGAGGFNTFALNPLGGNILIGTTTDAGFKLDVNGTARVTGQLSSGITGTHGNISVRRASDGNIIGQFYTNGNETFIKENQGAGGILLNGFDTTSLKWVGTNNHPRVGIGFNGTINATCHISGASSVALLEIDSPTVNNILFVSGSGNVGIGTGTPTQVLDVIGTARATSALLANDLITINNSAQGSNATILFPANSPFFYANTYAFNFGATSNGGGAAFTNGVLQVWNQLNLNNLLILSDGNSTANERLRVTKGGNVLIGTTTDSGYKLDVNGDTKTLGLLTAYGISTNLSDMAIYNTTNNTGYIRFITQTSSAQAERMRIFNTGNVGINTTTDAGYKLDVNGTARVSGNLTLGTNNPQLIWTTGVFQLFYSTTRLMRVDFEGNYQLQKSLIVASSSSTAINASAVMQADSTTKGFLPPRMTGAQAEAISSPAEGLMVYATDGTGVTITSKGWWGYDGATWVKFN